MQKKTEIRMFTLSVHHICFGLLCFVPTSGYLNWNEIEWNLKMNRLTRKQWCHTLILLSSTVKSTQIDKFGFIQSVIRPNKNWICQKNGHFKSGLFENCTNNTTHTHTQTHSSNDNNALNEITGYCIDMCGFNLFECSFNRKSISPPQIDGLSILFVCRFMFPHLIFFLNLIFMANKIALPYQKESFENPSFPASLSIGS